MSSENLVLLLWYFHMLCPDFLSICLVVLQVRHCTDRTFLKINEELSCISLYYALDLLYSTLRSPTRLSRGCKNLARMTDFCTNIKHVKDLSSL